MHHLFRRLAVTLSLLTLATTPLRAQPTGCLPSDSVAQDLLVFARGLAVSSDSNTVKMRASAGFTLMDSTKVIIERAAQACTAAVAGVNVAMRTPNQARLIHLIRMNTQGFLAIQPTLEGNPNSEWTPMFVLTKTGAYRMSFLY